LKKIYIVNPAAGHGKAKRMAEELKNSQSDCESEILITSGAGDATEIARRYSCGDNRVYSVGGDGTINEVINGSIGGESRVCIIPAGSGNDLIRSVDDISGDCDIDVGSVNGRYFANIASIGFDADVAHNAKRFKKIPLLGGLSYYISIFYTLIKKKPLKVTIDIEGEPEFCGEKELLLLAVANGKYYGGGIKIAPSARINDGLLDICIIENLSRFKILTLLPKFFAGTHEKLKQVKFVSAKKIKILRDEPGPISIDGEIISVKDMDFDILPGGLKIFV